MRELNGFLFSKLQAIGSRSEGPVYFLQQFDEKEIPILKKVHLWEEDPVLQKLLGKKVTLHGRLSGGRIEYKDVHVLLPAAA